jgi:phosphopantetheine adenylyltransferase
MNDFVQGWHLDKRVPVSIIAVLLFQFIAAIVLVVEMRSDINGHAKDIQRLDAVVTGISTASNAQAIQLGRIEENIGALRVDIQRLLRAMEGPR